ncbi:TetR/AcrR family transcriptional regulator [Nonomuraea lactucae]|uniref:TetR/AcrR family transcriptional regulator n=1 Tax=Nonomuraea lactucae TaxID=2249762 RepID=UPI000DE4EF58|nr:TetR/AcrR family transcriptional regulator [Nonomuraea lactucae]
MAGDARPKRRATGAAVFSPEVTEAITAAALDELAAKGFAGMSMDAVARRASVGKSAIYRRWPSKERMVVEALGELIVLADHFLEDTGSLRGDVRAALDEMVEWLSDERISRIYTDMLAQGLRSPAMADALTTHIGRPRRTRAMVIFDRAERRGELSASADRELILDLMGAMVFWKVAARREKATPEYLDRVAAAIVAAVDAIS